MSKLCVLILLLAFLGAVVCEEALCCPPNSHLILHKLGSVQYFCSDAETNATSELSLSCADKATSPSIVAVTKSTEWQVNDAGDLVYRVLGNDITFGKGTFCLSYLSYKAKSGVTHNRSLLVLCGAEEDDQRTSQQKVLGYCMIVSTVFLLGTACIYIALPELRDLQGKSTVNFCISLGTGLGVLASLKLIEEYSDMKMCAARGFFTYFFLIAAFFWSNAISVQILLSTRKPTQSIHGWREFLWYALYAWGGPSLLTVAMAIVNFIPGDHQKPGLGLNHCWFLDMTLQWQYMYSIMTILILINAGIFIYTSWLLWRVSFTSSNHMRVVRYKLLMMVRLFVVMGIPWITEMIGSIFSSGNIMWMIADVINSLQGVFVFLVLVVFRRRVVKLMYQHGWLGCVSGKVEQWLAVKDDEEDTAHYTIGVTLDEMK